MKVSINIGLSELLFDCCLMSNSMSLKVLKVQHQDTVSFLAHLYEAGLGGSVGCASDWRPGGRGFDPRRGRQHSFAEIDHEIFSTVILSLPLIQEGQLSVSGERMCTILVNRLEDKACPVNVWLGKLTALDMTPLGWLGRKTSTQTNKSPVWKYR